MIKVVLDANIFVSALLKHASLPAKIVDLVHEGIIELIISKDILSEVRAVLQYPKLVKRHKRSLKQIDVFLSKTRKVAFLTPGQTKIEAIKDDPEDNKYLACALEGKVDFIISGDSHLKDLKSFQGIRIVDPSTFLKLIEK